MENEFVTIRFYFNSGTVKTFKMKAIPGLNHDEKALYELIKVNYLYFKHYVTPDNKVTFAAINMNSVALVEFVL